jgi:hypothetical protein
MARITQAGPFVPHLPRLQLLVGAACSWQHTAVHKARSQLTTSTSQARVRLTEGVMEAVMLHMVMMTNSTVTVLGAYPTSGAVVALATPRGVVVERTVAA